MDLIRAHRPLHVLVLAGDHIYKMDYGPMIGFHVEKEADITVGVVEVPVDQSARVRRGGRRRHERVLDFLEKPENPPAMPGRPDIALASMGIYVFNPRLLERCCAPMRGSAVGARLRQEHHPGGDRQAPGVRVPVRGRA